jgi:hypothetical protein
MPKRLLGSKACVMRHRVSTWLPVEVKGLVGAYLNVCSVAVWLVAQRQRVAQVVVEPILAAGWHHHFVHADQCLCQSNHKHLRVRLSQEKALDDQADLVESVIRESKRVDLEVISNAS